MKNQGGVISSLKGVVVFEEESGVDPGAGTFGPSESPSDDPPGNNRESCFPLKLAKLGTLILEKRTTPDFKKFSLG